MYKLSFIPSCSEQLNSNLKVQHTAPNMYISKIKQNQKNFQFSLISECECTSSCTILFMCNVTWIWTFWPSNVEIIESLSWIKCAFLNFEGHHWTCLVLLCGNFEGHHWTCLVLLCGIYFSADNAPSFGRWTLVCKLTFSL